MDLAAFRRRRQERVSVSRSNTRQAHAKGVRTLLKNQRGTALTEYGLLLAFVALIATVVLIGDPLHLKTAIIGAFTKAVTALNGN